MRRKRSGKTKSGKLRQRRKLQPRRRRYPEESSVPHLLRSQPQSCLVAADRNRVQRWRRVRQVRDRRNEHSTSSRHEQFIGALISMANQQGNGLTAIDVGSAKTCALMVEVTDSGLRYRGHGVAESRGSRKGVIVELDKAVAAIQKAVETAEDKAGAAVEHAIVGIGGGRARGGITYGAAKPCTPPPEDAREAKEQPRARARPTSRHA